MPRSLSEQVKLGHYLNSRSVDMPHGRSLHLIHGSTSYPRAAATACRTGQPARPDADALAQEAISRYLAEEARFVEAVKLGEAALDRGEYLTHEQVGERIDRLFRS